MATNNAINLKSSGIASYDAAGTFTALANPLTVSNGGTGDASVTAYAVLCGGTTSTAAVQSIAGLGSSTHVLTSNGAGALPTFQAAPTGGGNVIFASCSTFSIVDGTIYYTQGATASALNAQVASTRYYIPVSGTITKVYGSAYNIGTLSSNESSTLALRLNNTTDTTISSAIKFDVASMSFNNTGLSISVSASDFIEVKMSCATFATNPTGAGWTLGILIT